MYVHLAYPVCLDLLMHDQIIDEFKVKLLDLALIKRIIKVVSIVIPILSEVKNKV